jgi:hypothetical protein
MRDSHNKQVQTAAMMVHHNGLMQPDSIGLGVGVFALVGAFMLYRIWFWR